MRILLLIATISFLFFIPTEVNAGINIDLSLPLGFKSISPVQFSTVKNDRIVLKGELKDDFKLKSVRIKGDDANIIDNGFETEDIQLKEGMNSFLIELTDVNGRRRLVSYSLIYDPKTAGPGGGSLVDRPILAVDMIAEGYTSPRPRKKLSTRMIRRAENPPSSVNKSNADVVFSSPYTNQVITEDKLKIGGRFNTNTGIKAITVNDQPCELEQSSGTFKGPMLISPGEARTKMVNSDSKDYILMKVDPVSHSGKNELIVKITPSEGKPYEDRIIFYYYQFFVDMHTNGEYRIKADYSNNVYTAPINAMMYNKDLFCDPPGGQYFSGWEYPEENYREFYYDRYVANYCSAILFYSGYYNYDSYTGPFYVNYSNRTGRVWFFMSPNELELFKNGKGGGHYSEQDTIQSAETILTLHTPPSKDTPIIILLRNCRFIENDPLFSESMWVGDEWHKLQLNLDNYKVNGQPLRPLCGDFGKDITWDDIEGNCAYVALNDFEPDKDFLMDVDVTSYATEFYGEGRDWTRFFTADVEYGITGDILIDSNNDGLLGGEDNAYEMVSPGCVFWVNDDDDSSESTVHQDDLDAANDEFDKDYEDDAINGIRDLEDFMPFNLAIPNINEWENTQNVKFYLKTEGQGKIRVFKRAKDMWEYGAKTYLSDLGSSKFQYQEKMKFLLLSDDNKEEGQLLDPAWFDSNGKFYGIFEGVEKGPLKLILEVQLGEGDNKKRVVLDEAYLTLKNVRDMYRFVNVRDGPTVGNTDDKLRYRNVNLEKSDMFMLDPLSIYIFIHGASTPESDAVTWSNTVYKRLYRTGYRGGFIGFSWNTGERLDLILPKLIFDNQWVRSFQTGQVLADVIDSTKNEFNHAKINLIAHSLGGNLTSYALRLLAVQDKKKLVDNVFLIQTAVTGNAFATEPHVDYYKDMYVYSIANNITGKAYNLYYVPDKLIYLFYEDLIGAWWTDLFLGEPGLPVPLDDDYELLPSDQMKDLTDVDYYRHEKSESGGIGNKLLISKLSNFMSKTYFNENNRPFGIRDHLSFGTEYYYDVKEYFDSIVNPINIEKRRQ
ncbi:MAG: alpha/beta hydrolase [Candidatus Omnitrophota bacterium]